MLSTEKLSKSFLAIIQEAEKLLETNLSQEQEAGLKTIISIAKHQSDIRGATGSHGKCQPKGA